MGDVPQQTPGGPAQGPEGFICCCYLPNYSSYGSGIQAQGSRVPGRLPKAEIKVLTRGCKLPETQGSVPAHWLLLKFQSLELSE